MPHTKEILANHFDSKFGSPYWLDLKKRLPFDPCREINSRQDFHLLGAMDIEALRRRPLLDFIPQRYHQELSKMILSETGGTTGSPCRRIFSPKEFEQAFLGPWERAAAKRGFPRQESWLFIGPSGPHIIGQAARAMARRLGSLECFSVDCDVRWFRKQAPDSLGALLYLDHVLDQALNIISTQNIKVLFTTAPILASLTTRLSSEDRQKIQGIHLGGIKIGTEEYHKISRDDFPNAVLLPGYGNSLFGVAFEDTAAKLENPPVYFIDDPALWLQIIPDQPMTGKSPFATTQPLGKRGRLVLHRLDKSFMIINLLERDTAQYSGDQNHITKIEPHQENTSNAVGLY